MYLLRSIWVRLSIAIVIGVVTAAATGWQYRRLRPDPALLATDPQTPPALPYACPIAGDCKLPGDDRRKGDVPSSETSTLGIDRILPPDDKR